MYLFFFKIRYPVDAAEPEKKLRDYFCYTEHYYLLCLFNSRFILFLLIYKVRFAPHLFIYLPCWTSMNMLPFVVNISPCLWPTYNGSTSTV